MRDVRPLACQGIGKRFGPITALDAVDLEVPAGSVTGFLGPNGAGKTTLLRIVAGLLQATTGQATIFGVDVRQPVARARLGAMPADPVFFPALTGRQNLDLLASLQAQPAVDRAAACAALALDDDVLDRPAGTYSSGMRQKLGIVAAVQHRPDLVVLDEPANRLDPIAHHAFEQLMRDIASRGRAVLLSSHTLPEVEELCDRIVMVQRGRVLVAASADDLVQRARRVMTVHFSGDVPRLPDGIADVAIDGHLLTARVAARRTDLLRAVLDLPGVDDVLVQPASLEDVFLDLYTGDGA